MGGKRGHRSSHRRGAAPDALTPRAAASPAPGAAPGDLTVQMMTLDGLIAANAEITRRFVEDDPPETTQRNLACALRGIRQGAELLCKRELPDQMKALAAQLQADREERARMESGVQFADEGAELPPLGGDECH